MLEKLSKKYQELLLPNNSELLKYDFPNFKI